MKCIRVLFLVSMLSVSAAMLGQGGSTPAPASSAPQAQTAPAPPSSIADVVDQQVSSYERNVVGIAEAMPADKYDFTPESLKIPGANYTGVRTFAQLIKHTATANYRFWSIVSGEKMPDNIRGTNGPDELKTKDDILKFLKDSFAMGHRAAKSLTTENALQQVPFFRGTSSRLYIAIFAVIHAADEYGQMVEYVRMNGIVPPASQSR